MKSREHQNRLRARDIASPAGAQWNALLGAFVTRATALTVVIARADSLRKHALCRDLESQLLSEVVARSWPGSGEQEPQRVLRYRYDRRAADALMDASDSLAGLAQGGIGDVSFHDETGREWFVSIFHEQTISIVASDAEWRALLREIPDLAPADRRADRPRRAPR